MWEPGSAGAHGTVKKAEVMMRNTGLGACRGLQYSSSDLALRFVANRELRNDGGWTWITAGLLLSETTNCRFRDRLVGRRGQDEKWQSYIMEDFERKGTSPWERIIICTRRGSKANYLGLFPG